MERETIEYNGKKYNRYPNSKRRHLRVYYWRHSGWKESPKALHRDIWQEANGEIPKGYVIHHKDGNSLNNNIENLQIMSKGEHQSKHSSNEERKKDARKNLRKYAQPKAKEWHKSEEGSEWHKQHYKKSLCNATKYKHTCEECDKEYESTRKTKTKFCSNKCQQRNWWRNNEEKRLQYNSRRRK